MTFKNYYCAYVVENGEIIVWGLGTSEKSAWDDAKNQIKTQGLEISNFIVKECTKCLFNDVDFHGGEGKFYENEEGLIDVVREKLPYEEAIETYRSYKRMNLFNVSHDTYETIEHLAFTLQYLDVEGCLDESIVEEYTLYNLCECLESACKYAIEENKNYRIPEYPFY